MRDPQYEEEICSALVGQENEGRKGGERPTGRLRGCPCTGSMQSLLEQGDAYYCFCSEETLEEERQAMLAWRNPALFRAL